MGIRKFVCRRVHGAMDGAMSMARELMPGAVVGNVGSLFVPPAGGGVRVDVREEMDDVIVVADLPGVDRENLVVRLVSPTELGITGARCSETVEAAGGGLVTRRERTCERMHRVVSFSSDATAEGARASYENGVLTVRLKKAERGERIPVE